MIYTWLSSSLTLKERDLWPQDRNQYANFLLTSLLNHIINIILLLLIFILSFHFLYHSPDKLVLCFDAPWSKASGRPRVQLRLSPIYGHWPYQCHAPDKIGTRPSLLLSPPLPASLHLSGSLSYSVMIIPNKTRKPTMHPFVNVPLKISAPDGQRGDVEEEERKARFLAYFRRWGMMLGVMMMMMTMMCDGIWCFTPVMDARRRCLVGLVGLDHRGYHNVQKKVHRFVRTRWCVNHLVCF